MKNLVSFLFSFLITLNVALSQSTENLVPFKYGNFYGLKNKEGKVVVAPEYMELKKLDNKNWYGKLGKRNVVWNNKGEVLFEYIENLGNFNSLNKNTYFASNENKENKYGLINSSGKLVLPFKYEYFSNFNEDLCIFEGEKKKGVFGITASKIILDTLFDEIKKISDLWGNELLVASRGEKETVVTSKGKIVIKDVSQTQFFKDKYFSCEKNNNTIYIDNEGKLYNKLSDIEIFKIYAYKENELYGFKNEKNQWVVAPQYNAAEYLSDANWAIQQNDGKWGVFNVVQNKFIVEPKYDSFNLLTDGVFSFEQKGKYHLWLVAENRMMDEILWDAAEMKGSFIDVYVFAKVDSTICCIDRKGKIFVPAVKGELVIDDNPFVIKRNNKYGIFIHPQGEYLPFVCDTVYRYESNLELTLTRYIVEQNAKSGIINYKGDLILDFKYDSIIPSSEFERLDVFACKKDGKWGVVGAGDVALIPCIYDSIISVDELFADNYCDVKRNGKYGVINANGTEVIECKYDLPNIKIQLIAGEGYIKVVMNKQVGLLDQSGKTLVPCQYDDVDNFSSLFEGFKVVSVQKDGKYGVYDINEGEKIPCIMTSSYDDISNEQGNFNYFSIDEKIGLFDKNYNIIVPAIYSRIEDTETLAKKGYAIVSTSDATGVINAQGKLIIPCKYKDVEVDQSDKEIRFLAFASDKLYIYNSSGKIIDELALTPSNNTEGRAMFKLENGKYGYVGYNGEWQIKPQFDDVQPFDGGLAIVAKDSSLGVIDGKGNFVVPCKYKRIYLEKDYINVEENDGREIIMKRDGSIVIPAKYDYIEEGTTNFFTFRYDKYGIVDKKGKEILPAYFESIDYYPQYILAITPSQKTALLDTNGKMLIDTLYKIIGKINNDAVALKDICFGVEKNKKVGLIDSKGKILLPIEYDEISYENGHYILQKNELLGVADATFKIILPASYSKIEYDDYNGGRFYYEKSDEEGNVINSGFVYLKKQ